MDLSTKRFIYKYSKKIGLVLNSYLTINDIYNEAYIFTNYNNKDLYLNISKIMWIEKSNQLGNRLRFKEIPKEFEKKCTDCKEFKNQMEFKRKYYKIGNYICLNYRCNSCEYKYQTNWVMNKYNNNSEYRERRLQYQREYRLRIKKNKV